MQFDPLPDFEKIGPDDYVEDVETGRYEPVGQGFYKFLCGQPVKSAVELPNVHWIVRKKNA